ELAQASRRGVARIRKQALATLELLSVEPREILLRNHHLSAHFQDLGPALAGKPPGHGLDGADIRSHVLARRTVAARACQHQNPALIAQADRSAVELRLGRVGNRVSLESLPATPVPF